MAIQSGARLFRSLLGAWVPSWHPSGTGTVIEDQSRQENDGNFVGGISWETDSANGGVRAINMAGGTGVNLGASAAIGTNHLRHFSVSVWVKPTGSGTRTILATGNQSDAQIRFRIFSNGRVGFGIAFAPSSHEETESSVSIANGQWHHLVGTFDGPRTWQRLYVNGVQDGEDLGGFTASVLRDTAADLNVGNFAGSNTYNGSWDSLLLFERVLSAAEIAHLATSRTAYPRFQYDNDSAAVYIPSNDLYASPTSVTDQVGVNDGVVIGATKDDEGLKFNGINDRVDINPLPAVAPNEDFAISAWVKVDASTFWAGIFGTHFGATSPTGVTELALNGNLLEPTFRVDGGLLAVAYGEELTAGQWHHLLGRYRSDILRCELFVDGVFAAQSPVSGGHRGIAGFSWSIGARPGDAGAAPGFLAGNVDDARFIARAVEQPEITYLASARAIQPGYNKLFGLGGLPADPRLRASWLCQDNAASTQILDSSGRGRHGTLSAGTSAGFSAAGPDKYRSLSIEGDGAVEINTNVSLYDFVNTNAGTILHKALPNAVGAGSASPSQNEQVLSDDIGAWGASYGTGEGNVCFGYHINDGAERIVELQPRAVGLWHHVQGSHDKSSIRVRMGGEFVSLSPTSELVGGGDARLLASAGAKFNGRIAGVAVFNDVLADIEGDEHNYGPEPEYDGTVPPQLTIDATSWSGYVGDWAPTLNGEIEFLCQLIDNATGQVVEEMFSDTPSGSGSYAGIYYLAVTAFNDGGPTARVISARESTHEPEFLEGLGGEQIWLCPSRDWQADGLQFVSDLSDPAGHVEDPPQQWNGTATGFSGGPNGGEIEWIDSDGKRAVQMHGDSWLTFAADVIEELDGGEITLSVWVNLDDLTRNHFWWSKPNRELCDFYLGGTTIETAGTDNRIYANIRPIQAGNTAIATNVFPTANTWHHLLWRYNASASVSEIWLDGVRIKQGITQGNYVPISFIEPLLFGRSDDRGQTRNNFGRWDDARIINRAIVNAEIAHLASERGVLGKPDIDIVVSPTLGTSRTVGFAPTVTIGENLAAIGLTGISQSIGFAPTVNTAGGITEVGQTGLSTSQGFAPSTSVSDNIAVPTLTGASSTIGFEPSVRVDDNIAVVAETGASTTIGFEPSVAVDGNVAVTAEAGISQTVGFAPSVAAAGNVVVTAPAGASTTVGFVPTVTVEENLAIEPETGISTSIGFAPSIAASGNVTVTCETGASRSLGFAPTVDVDKNVGIAVELGASTSEGFAPTVAVDGNVAVAAEPGISTTIGFVPSVAVDGNVAVAAATGISTTAGGVPTVTVDDNVAVVAETGISQSQGFAPSTLIDRNVTVVAARGVSESSGAVPTVGIGGNISVGPSTGASQGQGFAPTIEIGIVQAATPGGSQTIGFAPSVAVDGNVAVTAETGASSTRGYAPSVRVDQGVIVTAAAGVSQSVGFEPAVAIGGSISVTTEPGGSTSAGFVPTVSVNENIAAVAQTGASGTAGSVPTVAVGTGVTPATLTGHSQTTGYAPTVLIDGSVLASPSTGRSESLGLVPTVNVTDAGLGTHVVISAGSPSTLIVKVRS